MENKPATPPATSPKAPSEMSISELKSALASRGLSTIGLVEKHELLSLLLSSSPSLRLHWRRHSSQGGARLRGLREVGHGFVPEL